MVRGDWSHPWLPGRLFVVPHPIWMPHSSLKAYGMTRGYQKGWNVFANIGYPSHKSLQLCALYGMLHILSSLSFSKVKINWFPVDSESQEIIRRNQKHISKNSFSNCKVYISRRLPSNHWCVDWLLWTFNNIINIILKTTTQQTWKMTAIASW